MGGRVSRSTLVVFATLAVLAGLAINLVVGVTDGPGTRAHSDLTTPSATSQRQSSRSDPPSARGAVPDRPNIVMVMADDMRVDDLAFAPNLRRLVVEHGVTFENSFSPFPLCCPARASFLTGQYAHNHKVLWHEPPFGYGSFDDSRTIATSLQAAGYRTGFVGKYLNRYGKDLAKVTGEPSSTYVPAGWTDWRAAIENNGDGTYSGDTYDYFDTAFNINGVIDDNHAGEYSSQVIGDFSVDMAAKLSAERAPFFMYVNYVAPHHGDPWEPDDPPAVHDTMGRPVNVVTPARPDWVKGRYDDVVDRASGIAVTGEGVEEDLGDKPAIIRMRGQRFTPEALAALRDATRQRAESIHVMDLHIARLVKQLKRSGEWDDTVFMFTSDNGMLMGEHGLSMTKVRAYEPSLRVPLLVTGPGLREKQSRFDPVSTVDVSATILDLAGADAPHPADGLSRVRTLRQGDQGWSTPVVTEAVRTSGGDDPAFTDRRTTIGIRVSRYSYTRYRDGTGELYDLKLDPRQDVNVYYSPDYAEVRRALDRMWPRLKDCDGDACAQSLPRLLAADPVTNEATTTAYWDEVLAAYGWAR